MTNISAFTAYMNDENKAILVLSLYDIVPENSDNTKASMALGMIERADDVDYRQLNTSETLSDASRRDLRARGISILESLGIEYIYPQSNNTITGGGF